MAEPTEPKFGKAFGNKEAYDSNINTPSGSSYYYEKFHAPVIEAAKKISPDGKVTLLGIACGPGNEFEFMQGDPSLRIIGFDIAPELIKQARDRFGGTAAEFGFFVGDTRQLPLREGIADVAVAVNAIIYNPGEVFDAAQYGLKPGGRFVVNARIFGNEHNKPFFNTQTGRGATLEDAEIDVNGEKFPLKVVNYANHESLPQLGKQVYFTSEAGLERFIAAKGFTVDKHDKFHYSSPDNTNNEVEVYTLQKSELNKSIEGILEMIRGEVIEQGLLDLAQIGGEVEKVDKKVAVTRLALSEEDIGARVLLKAQMEDAGMQVEDHPMGLIGVYPGENPDLPAVMLMSHFDSVPNGGMYDGTVGIVSSIEIVRLLHENGVRLPRSIMVLALTGEESARFNVALTGSKAVFQGLTDKELDAGRFGDLSLREALNANGFNADDVRNPRFKPEEVYGLIELHVSQSDFLEQRGKDLAVIEAIAAPDRREITIGDPIEPDIQEPPNARYIRVSAAGESGHTGATPMGMRNRADVLPHVATIIGVVSRELRKLREDGRDIDVSVGRIAISDQSLNKIPGKAEFTVRVEGKDVEAAENIVSVIRSYTNGLNVAFNKEDLMYDYSDPPRRTLSFNATEQEEPDRDEIFYSSKDIMPRQALAAGIVSFVRDIANSYQYQEGTNIVGTVSTYHINEKGQIILGIDIRSTNLEVRNAVTSKMEEVIKKLSKGPNTTLILQKEFDELPNLADRAISSSSRFGPVPAFVRISSEGPVVNYESRRLPGSGEPTLMDRRLVDLTKKVIEQYKLGSCEVTFSPAGHDTQNAARAGIPTVMIFIPSRNGGASHNPREYSTPEDLGRGTRALAALAMTLASDPSVI
ncbi:M20/M25/M40 family metallo-hydrolase [Patescibacteria group bacterium]|nr:M20/M25/M40 family metallo-hydrolase [Patescibacteria group bacterium]